MLIKSVIAVVCMAALAVLTGCNKRIYFGMDDYGETSSMRHEFNTKGDNQESRRARR